MFTEKYIDWGNVEDCKQCFQRFKYISEIKLKFVREVEESIFTRAIDFRTKYDPIRIQNDLDSRSHKFEKGEKESVFDIWFLGAAQILMRGKKRVMLFYGNQLQLDCW